MNSIKLTHPQPDNRLCSFSFTAASNSGPITHTFFAHSYAEANAKLAFAVGDAEALEFAYIGN